VPIASWQDKKIRKRGIGVEEGLMLKVILECPDYRPLGNIAKGKPIAHFQAYTLLEMAGI